MTKASISAVSERFSEAGAPEVSPTDARELLARVLVKEMERLDPTEDWDPKLCPDENWNRLDERRKTFYRMCISALLLEEHWVRIALGS